MTTTKALDTMSTLEELATSSSGLLASIPDVPLHTIFDLDHKDLLLSHSSMSPTTPEERTLSTDMRGEEEEEEEEVTTATTFSISATVATVDLSDPDAALLPSLLAPSTVASTTTSTTMSKAECLTCGKRFSNASALAKHKLTHSQERRYPCSLCHKAFKRQDHLNGHLLTHRTTKPFACSVCDKSYCDARSLRRHRENHHGQVGGHRVRLQQEQAIAQVRDHITVRSKRKSKSNNINCGKKERTDMSETNTVSMRCTVCQRNFKNAPALNGHMRLHGGYAKSERRLVAPSPSATSTSTPTTTTTTTSTLSTAIVHSASTMTTQMEPTTADEVATTTTAVARLQPNTDHLLAMLDTSASLPCIRLPTHPLPPLLVSLPTFILAPTHRLVMTTTTPERRPRLGNDFQAELPELISSREESEEAMDSDDELMWRPETEQLVSSMEDLENFLQLTSSCLMPGGGNNMEMGLQMVERNDGDLLHSMQTMLNPSDPLGNKEERHWQPRQVDAFYRHLIGQKKNFDEFSETGKSREECVHFYYTFKNLLPGHMRQIKHYWNTNKSDVVLLEGHNSLKATCSSINE